MYKYHSQICISLCIYNKCIAGVPCSECVLKFYLLICFTAPVLKVCMTPDPTAKDGI